MARIQRPNLSHSPLLDLGEGYYDPWVVGEFVVWLQYPQNCGFHQ